MRLALCENFLHVTYTDGRTGKQQQYDNNNNLCIGNWKIKKYLGKLSISSFLKADTLSASATLGGRSFHDIMIHVEKVQAIQLVTKQSLNSALASNFCLLGTFPVR